MLERALNMEIGNILRVWNLYPKFEGIQAISDQLHFYSSNSLDIRHSIM